MENTNSYPNSTQGETSSKRVPKYRGVRMRKWGKWVSEIRLVNSRERIWLGSYDTQEKAARAFDAALYCLRGNRANFNFPENPPRIPGGESLSPQEIQSVANRYANEAPLSSSSSVEMMEPEEDNTRLIDEGEDVNIDWSSLRSLDDHGRSSPSAFGAWTGLDSDFYPTQPLIVMDNADDDIQNEDGHHIDSLWNF